MKRRNFLLGASAVTIGGALLLKPKDEGAPHPEYFARLNAELKKHGPMRPVMLVDLDRLDQNIDLVMQSIAKATPTKNYRVVAKSIPSAAMIDYVMKRAETHRIMAFHQPFLNQQAKRYHRSDILLGKPMPVAAAANFYRSHFGAFDSERQLQWLIDTPERLIQYLELAKGQRLKMRINIELDVGLHRGGVTAGEALAAMLSLIVANPDNLVFSGFMGYDPHVVKVPSIFGEPEELLADAMEIYQEAIDQVQQDFPGLWNGGQAADGLGLTLNTAGSPTYRLHESETVSNEIAVGSALVKPSDFDVPTLEGHTPAAFIATPVLKHTGGVRIPGLDGKTILLTAWDINQREAYFTYGGYWKAKYESPPGLRNSELFGHSTNQELVSGSPATALAVDDQIFLRPTQSEFVFLQFGDLLAVRDGRIVDEWPVFHQNEHLV